MSKYNRTYHLPWSPGTTSDDRIAPSVESLIGIDLVITEKLDGENCGMSSKGVYARSHAAYTTSPWSREVRSIHEVIKSSIDEDVFIFGENMEGIHSIEYSKELKTLTESRVSQPSALGGKREGIVVRNADMFHNEDFSTNVMKWVRKGHVTTDEHWTRNWKKAKINREW